MRRSRKPIQGQLPLERPRLESIIPHEHMIALAKVVRKTPDGVIRKRHLTECNVADPGKVLAQIDSGTTDTRLDCINYVECLGNYVRYYGDASEVPARCPRNCQFHERTPRHAAHALACTRTESQWSMTAIPEQGWDRKRNKEEDDDDAIDEPPDAA